MADFARIGASVGNYRIEEVVGEGGMGVVYLARHEVIGRRAAIKVLRPEYSHKKELVARFFNEARAASMVRHPGIVEVFDVGYLIDGAAYIAMEYLEGWSLRERFATKGPLSPLTAARIGRQAAGALVAAHERTIIHRDVKPENIFLVVDPDVPGGQRIKLLDFGIAKLSGALVEATAAGTIMGTPAYMAPEQWRGEPIDHRADIYGLATVLYEMVAGHRPFEADSPFQFAQLVLRTDAPRLSSVAAAPPALENAIMRGLARDARLRHQTMAHFADALSDALSEMDADPRWAKPTATHRLTSSVKTVLATVPVADETLIPGAFPFVGGGQPKGKAERGLSTIAAASAPSGFFHGLDLSRSRFFGDANDFFAHVRATFEFYRRHLDEEYRQLSEHIRTTHLLWVGCVGLGFLILLAGLGAVLFGNVPQGVGTALASTLVYFIVRVFQQREDHYTNQRATKMKHLEYGNDWLLLVQSIESIPEGEHKLEHQRRLAEVLLRKIEGRSN